MWIDLILLFLLFVLFAYVFITVNMTNLHKAYLIFHFFMMIWPYCQFVIKVIDDPQIQLIFVKLAFVDLAMLGVGWILFTLFLTGHSLFPRKAISLAIAIPALFVSLAVIFNPRELFVKPVDGHYIERSYGPLFWFSIAILVGYILVSLYIMYMTLLSYKGRRIKKQVMQTLIGLLVLTAFFLSDICVNVVFRQPLTVTPGLTSLGILLSAIIFVISIHRDKVFDIVTVAHQDIIDTITLGIVVLDDNERIVEINRSLPSAINLRVGDRFDPTAILPMNEPSGKKDLFVQAYHERPLESAEIEVLYHGKDPSHVNIQIAPIMVGTAMAGRIITFQDMSTFRHLIQKLERMALTDSLTNCYNRHYLTQHLEREVMVNMRDQIPFTLILIDIDFFKSINDSYGHLVGDEVIRGTVEAIKQILRPDDILARYGGEEFIVYLPNTNPPEASRMAERIKFAVESNKMILPTVTPALSITISMGLLSIDSLKKDPLKDPKTILNDLFQSVDNALYQAKREGRNRIVSKIR